MMPTQHIHSWRQYTKTACPAFGGNYILITIVYLSKIEAMNCCTRHKLLTEAIKYILYQFYNPITTPTL